MLLALRNYSFFQLPITLTTVAQSWSHQSVVYPLFPNDLYHLIVYFCLPLWNWEKECSPLSWGCPSRTIIFCIQKIQEALFYHLLWRCHQSSASVKEIRAQRQTAKHSYEAKGLLVKTVSWRRSCGLDKFQVILKILGKIRGNWETYPKLLIGTLTWISDYVSIPDIRFLIPILVCKIENFICPKRNLFVGLNLSAPKPNWILCKF